MTVKNIVSTSNKKVLKFQGKEKLKILIKNLNTGLIGKEDIIKTSLLSILAQENLILFGPPGTAKSEISRRISSVIDTGNYFEYLLTKFTTPEEIFGPLSIKELKEDRFYRKTEGYLPTVQIGFLDEIFKANSSILNTLLTIMNEKVFHNGNKKENTNLISLIGASNEDPSNDLELSALYDRFLVRKIVNYIQDDEIDQLFDISGEKFLLNESLKITRKEISDIEENLSKIAIPKDIREVIKKIRLDLKEEFKENNQEDISDRKLVKVLKLLKVSAYTNERDQVDISDVLLLKNCLWNNPENQKIVSDTIINNIKDGYKLIEISNGDKVFGTNNNRTLKKFDFKGMGTESNPFIIEDEADLIHIGTVDYLDKGYYFKQSKDIQIASHWHSIGSKEKPFKGNYNGNNKTISKLNNPLFFQINESIIEYLNLKEVDIDEELEKVGSVTNIAIDSCIRSCSVKGKIISTTNSSYSCEGGMIAGSVKGGSIENCSVDSDIKITNSGRSYSYGGGIAGAVDDVKIECCNVDGCVTTKNTYSRSYSPYGGGIVGRIDKGNIENCSVDGIITTATYSSCSLSSYGGGIAGVLLNDGIIGKCNINAVITSNSHSYLHGGGIVGCISGASIKNSTIKVEFSTTAGYLKAKGIAEKLFSKNIFSNNYVNNISVIDKNQLNFSDENSADGKFLDLDKFDEKLYKRLGWDFEKIWIWNNDKNIPMLRQANKISENIIEKISMEKNELSNILNNNIWI